MNVISGIANVVGSIFGYVGKKKEMESKEKLAILGVDDNAKIMDYAISQANAKKTNSIAKTAIAMVLALAVVIRLTK